MNLCQRYQRVQSDYSGSLLYIKVILTFILLIQTLEWLGGR